MSELKEDIQKIHEKLDRGFGPNYQSRVSRSILGKHAGIGNARVLRGPTPAPTWSSRKRSRTRKPDGVITKQESDELWLQDLIVRGVRREIQESVYVGTEVAIAAGSNVDRACRGAWKRS